MMFANPEALELREELTRRRFICGGGGFAASIALSSLLGAAATGQGVPRGPHFAPRAKRVISLFMSGGPSHVDLFDDKPLLRKLNGKPMPEEIIRNHEFAMIKSASPKVKGSPFKLRPRGESGNVISDLLPRTAEVADELCIIRSLHTDTFNHDPAVTMMNTGFVTFGKPSLGAWLSWGLGSENTDLPAYTVLVSGVKLQPLLTNYWGSGFLPSRHQGVQFRSKGDPVLFLSNPPGVDPGVRRSQLDLINWMNNRHFDRTGDPEIRTRIEAFELGYRMQSSVPGLMDISKEPQKVHELYGTKPGEVSFSNNCLLARRLVEKGVRCVQLYHTGWDQHGTLERDHRRQCAAVDQGAAALLADLKARGLLDETLVIWGGEFGRTPMAQGGGANYGRDHHPHGFSIWMAGGGIKPGITYGATDDFGYFATEKKVHVHDLHATVLHCLGVDHKRLVHRFQGRDFRLTDVHGKVVEGILG